MEKLLQQTFNLYVSKLGLKSALAFAMPKSHLTANGMYDDKTDTVYINRNSFSQGETVCLFYLLHEMYHAYQHKNDKWFVYYFEYDGKAYRFNKHDGSYFECYVMGEKTVLEELYLCNPVELEANNFAIDALKKMHADSSKNDAAAAKAIEYLCREYTPPLKIFTPEKKDLLFAFYCEAVELAYLGKLQEQTAVYKKIGMLI